MSNVTFQKRVFRVGAGQSVLEALLRQGENIPNSCRSGSCQCCLMRAVDGTTPPPAAQKGLKDTLKAQNYFLSCQCVPEEDLSVALPTADVAARISARVIEKSALSASVMRLRLACDQPLPDARAGQYIAFRRPSDGLTRSYSIARLTENGCVIELHIRRLPEGRMSGWAHDSLAEDDRVDVIGPSGNCFYLPDDDALDQPILMIATGAGLAPLWGVLNDALDAGHRGPIRLFHGSRDADGLYLAEELTTLAARHPNFTYTPCRSDGETGIRADAAAFDAVPKLTGWRVYLCGNPNMVKSAQRHAFLRGARMTSIYADPFVLPPPASADAPL